MRGWMVVAALIATPAMAAEQQFDLVCVAKKTTIRYRIDLERGEWCQGDCSVVERIISATSGLLTLKDLDTSKEGGLRALTTINRTTGAWFDLFYLAGSIRPPLERNGSCDSVSFSGFPKAKF